MQYSTSLLFTTFCHVHHMNVMRTWTFCVFTCTFFLLFTFLIFYSLFSLSHGLFSLNALPSYPLICLSICLSCVWPCPSLPLQEVVSKLIESRLRSLELNTCSEELLFNCSSHTLTLAGCSHVHIKHIDTV